MRKTLLVLAALGGLASLAAAQTVADAAQKEKERRVAQKPGTAVVVTNADLAKVKKQSAVKLPGEKAAAAAAGEAEAPPAPGAPAQNEGAVAVSTGQGADPRTAQVPSSRLEGNPKAVYEQRKADLERIWATAKERIDLLSIKMIGLQQQLAGAVQPGAKDQIQAALVETSKTLQDAQAAEKKAKEDLNGFVSGGK